MHWNKVWKFRKGTNINQLQMAEIEVDTPAANEVLVKVYVYGINNFDLLWISTSIEFPFGFEFCGEIVEIGKLVNQYKVGDIVIGLSNSTKQERRISEFCIAKEQYILHLSNNLSLQQGAALSYSGLIATQLIEKYNFKEKKVLIIGASGGIGHLFAQLILDISKDVFVVSKARNIDFLSSIGLKNFIETDDNDQWNTIEKFDYIIDFSGKYTNQKLNEYLGTNGYIITTKASEKSILSYLFSVFYKQNTDHFKLDISKKYFDLLSEKINQNLIIPKVHQSINGIENVQSAYHLFKERGIQGKLVLNLGC